MQNSHLDTTELRNSLYSSRLFAVTGDLFVKPPSNHPPVFFSGRPADPLTHPVAPRGWFASPGGRFGSPGGRPTTHDPLTHQTGPRGWQTSLVARRGGSKPWVGPGGSKPGCAHVCIHARMRAWIGSGLPFVRLDPAAGLQPVFGLFVLTRPPGCSRSSAYPAPCKHHANPTLLPL